MRVLIADDHEIVRRGLKRTLLEEFPFAYIDEAGDATQLVEKARPGNWDIIISDISMPGGGGMFALKEIRELHASLPILMLSIYSEDQFGVRVMQAGGSGYLNKDAAGEDLIKAVHRLVSGKNYFSEITLQKFRFTSSPVKNEPLHASLSERELAVFRLLASGMSIAEIAASLSVNASTVSTYRARILDKMNMKSNAELTMYANEFHII